jgi:hypothetical protein
MRRTPFGRLVVVVCVCCTAFFPSAGLHPSASAGNAQADPLVTEMLSQVQTDELIALVGVLSGEWPALVEDAQYSISSRYTNSGEPLQKATQYVYEYMQNRGLSPSFHNWDYRNYTGRNVTGTIPGVTLPDEIVLLTAHLDDVPWSGRAPGADDNASGSTALLEAADILSEYRFERTIRFAFFTGEEQGMLGSHEYASERRTAGDNIVAVLNLDMIAWDSLGAPDVLLHTRAGHPEDLAIASAFTNVASAYNLGLTPIVSEDGMGASDHVSFWILGYPAILVIEDDEDDFNDYYHSRSDRLYNFNLPYFTNFIKAAIGSAANLAEPMAGSPGVSRAQLSLPAAIKWSLPGEESTYTLQLTNTGSLEDTYQLAVSDNAWTTILPGEIGPLPVGKSVDVTVTVSVPTGMPIGTADIAFLNIFSVGSGLQVDSADLTTLIQGRSLYIPFIQQWDSEAMPDHERIGKFSVGTNHQCVHAELDRVGVVPA